MMSVSSPWFDARTQVLKSAGKVWFYLYAFSWFISAHTIHCVQSNVLSTDLCRWSSPRKTSSSNLAPTWCHIHYPPQVVNIRPRFVDLKALPQSTIMETICVYNKFDALSPGPQRPLWDKVEYLLPAVKCLGSRELPEVIVAPGFWPKLADCRFLENLNAASKVKWKFVSLWRWICLSFAWWSSFEPFSEVRLNNHA